MFQNIVNEIENDNQEEIKNKKPSKIKTILKSIFTKQNILMYII